MANINELIKKNVIFYYVDEKGTLTYLSHRKSGLKTVVIPLEKMHVRVQKNGNAKTGKEWLLNTLPGEHPIQVRKEDITNVRGSCQGCCDGCESYCYSINGAKQHHNSVLPCVIQNTILWRMDPARFEAELDAELERWKLQKRRKHPAERVFRWHASGEIEDPHYLEMMMRVAEKHPEVHFYSYTKRFKWIENYLDLHGDFPSNFTWNLSVWKDNLLKAGFPEKYLCKVQLFEWRDECSVEEYNHSIHCQSVVHLVEGEKKGHLNHEKNCRICGLCWRGKCKGRTILVYNH